MRKAKILLLDDEKEFLSVVKERLELGGYSVTACRDVDQALQEVHDQDFDVAIIDLILDETDGITTMTRMKVIRPLTECIVLSGQGTLRLAVEAMKQGAFEFLEKPCDHERMIHVIDSARARKQDHEKRIKQAAKRVYSRIEKAMVSATFAQSGQFESAKEFLDEE